jgi:hypothetical protein
MLGQICLTSLEKVVHESSCVTRGTAARGANAVIPSTDEGTAEVHPQRSPSPSVTDVRPLSTFRSPLTGPKDQRRRL